jgi:hypothetical protein
MEQAKPQRYLLSRDRAVALGRAAAELPGNTVVSMRDGGQSHVPVEVRRSLDRVVGQDTLDERAYKIAKEMDASGESKQQVKK